MSRVVPIASLTPAIAPPSTGSIRGIVTLYWPYSTLSKQCALLLADPDFRMRNKSGQIRVRFSGPSAELVAKSNISIGDEVTFELDGAKWAGAPTGVVSTPGKSVDGELEFNNTLGLQIAGRGSDGVFRVRSAPSTSGKSGEYQRNIAQTPIKPLATFHNGPNETVEDIPAHVYESPAFARRLKQSGEQYLDAAYDPFVDPDFDDGQGRHKRRKIMWRYLDGSHSPSGQSENDTVESDKDVESDGMSKMIWASELPHADFVPLSMREPAPMFKSIESESHSAPTVHTQEVEEIDSSPAPSGLNTPLATKSREGINLFSESSLSSALKSESTSPSNNRSKPPRMASPTVSPIREEQAHGPGQIERLESSSSLIESRNLDGGTSSNHQASAPSFAISEYESNKAASGLIFTQQESNSEEGGTKYGDESYPLESRPELESLSGTAYTDSTNTHDAKSTANDYTHARAMPNEGYRGILMSNPGVENVDARSNPLDSVFFDTISVYHPDSETAENEEELADLCAHSSETIVIPDLSVGRKLEAPNVAIRTQSAFGVDGAWSEIASTSQPPGLASSDKVMAETYRSLFGFQENESAYLNISPPSVLESSVQEGMLYQKEVDLRIQPDIELSDSSLNGPAKPSGEPTTNTAGGMTDFDVTQDAEDGAADHTFLAEDANFDTELGTSQPLEARKQPRTYTQNREDQLNPESLLNPAARHVEVPQIMQQQAIVRVASQIPNRIVVNASPDDQQKRYIQEGSQNESQTRNGELSLVESPNESHRESSVASVDQSSNVMAGELDTDAALESVRRSSHTFKELSTKLDVPDIVVGDQYHVQDDMPRSSHLDIQSSLVESQGAAIKQAPLDDSVQGLDQINSSETINKLVKSDVSEGHGQKSPDIATDIDSQTPGSGHNDRSEHQRTDEARAIEPTLQDPRTEHESLNQFQPTLRHVGGLLEHEQAASDSAKLVGEDPDELESITKVAEITTESGLGDPVNPPLRSRQDNSQPVSIADSSDSPGGFTQFESDMANDPLTGRIHTLPTNVALPIIENSSAVTPASMEPAESAEQEDTKRSKTRTAGAEHPHAMVDSVEHRHSTRNDTSDKQATDSTLRNKAAHQSLRTPTTKLVAIESQSARHSPSADGLPSLTERPLTRKSIPARLSQVPEVISSWFSPRRSSRLMTEGEKDIAAPKLADDEQQEHRKHSRRSTATGIATSYSYFTPLSNIGQKLNPPSQSYSNTAIDIIGVATKDTETPQRAKKGPRDFFVRVLVKDPSLDGEEHAVVAEVYRPWHAQLPVALAGDVILLRGFAVKSRKRQPYLLSTDSSAWCVWRFAENALDDDEAREKTPWAHRLRAGSFSGVKEEVKGPPVELGEEERIRAEELHGWWQGLQELAAEANGS